LPSSPSRFFLMPPRGLPSSLSRLFLMPPRGLPLFPVQTFPHASSRLSRQLIAPAFSPPRAFRRLFIPLPKGGIMAAGSLHSSPARPDFGPAFFPGGSPCSCRHSAAGSFYSRRAGARPPPPTFRPSGRPPLTPRRGGGPPPPPSAWGRSIPRRAAGALPSRLPYGRATPPWPAMTAPRRPPGESPRRLLYGALAERPRPPVPGRESLTRAPCPPRPPGKIRPPRRPCAGPEAA
jgi:hypothetical protein